MREPIPVTDEDLRAAWDALYYRAPEWSHLPVLPPNPEHHLDRSTLAGLRRVLEVDRRRVVEADNG